MTHVNVAFVVDKKRGNGTTRLVSPEFAFYRTQTREETSLLSRNLNFDLLRSSHI